MRILHVATEIAPIAKVGGLGDVIYGLARAQIKQGLDVRVIIPKFSILPKLKAERIKTFTTKFGKETFKNILWQTELDGIPLLLLEADWFNDGVIYAGKADHKRFLYFSRAVVDADLEADIYHLHDWQTAVLAGFYPNTVLTIHSLASQGRLPQSASKLIGIPLPPDPRERNKVNLMRLGIEKAARINAVSPTYAEEILTPAYGEGLQRILRKHQDKFSGILNGIDTNYWNPATDRYIEKRYSHPNERTPCKRALQREMGLKINDDPIVGIVTRLVPQKGVDLIYKTLPMLEGKVVILGDSPFPKIQKKFDLGLPNIRLGFDEALSHRIFAGADIIAVPSLFEPCGLTQMIALRYGAVPVVRRTGGLADTVNDSNGFTFEKKTAKAFQDALQRAFDLYQNKRAWQRLQEKGMRQDWSWLASAKHYLDMYRSIC